MASDLLAFVEPWLASTDSSRLEGFEMVSRINCPSSLNSYGSIVFSRNETICDNINFNSIAIRNGHIDVTTWIVLGIEFVIIYSHPLIKFDELMPMLSSLIQARSEVPTVIFGDFNMDLLCDKRLTKFFRDFLIKDRTPKIPSTDYGTKLDACFTNIYGLDAWFYESIFSDHKPICMTVPKGTKLKLFDELDDFLEDTVSPIKIQIVRNISSLE